MRLINVDVEDIASRVVVTTAASTFCVFSSIWRRSRRYFAQDDFSRNKASDNDGIIFCLAYVLRKIRCD